jgi:two-component system phosphate regulon sensor histidine kinase PhoR
LKLGIRARLFVVSLALIVVSVVVADALLGASLDRWLTQRIQDDLQVRVALVERQVAAAAPRLTSDDLDGWDALADVLGATAHARVTIIRKDGAVVGDSELARDALPQQENLANRPEVAAALTAGASAAAGTHFSHTIREHVLYVAVPGGPGVVRAAVPLADVDAAQRRIHWLLFAATVLLMAIAAIGLSSMTRRMTQVVNVLTDAARRMAGGDLNARTRIVGADELGELGKALDHLAGGLARTLGELRSERDLLSGILAAMNEGVLLLDGDGRVALVNPALREMLLLPAETVGKLPIEVIRDADLQELIDRVEETHLPATAEIELSGVKPRRLLARASILTGVPSASLPSGSGIRSLTGEPKTGLLVVFFDVTDLRKLESLRRDFVANVSHELRTPVTAVRSAAETLRGAASKDPDAAVRFIDIIERNAERLQNLVDDLLDLSRIESRQYQLRFEALALAAELQQAVDPMRERAEKKKLTLRAELAAAADLPPARADRRALQQVLANLIDNAIKYCGPVCTA